MPLDVSDLEWDDELSRLIIDNSLQGLLILQDERIIFVNKAVSEVSGYTPEELHSFSLKDLMAIVHPEDQERTFRSIENLIAGNSPQAQVRQEFRVIRKDGAIRWVETLASCLKYQNRPALHLAYLDITERKRTEDALYESNSLLRSFFDSPGVMRGIVEVIADDDVRHIADNEVTAGFLGLASKEMQNKLGSELGEPRDILSNWIRHYRQSQRSGKPVHLEYLDKRGDHDVWLSATVSYLGTALNGQPRFAYVVVDITERKRIEEDLRESEEKYHAAIDFTYDCETWLSPEGSYVYVSPSCERLTGYSTDEFLKDPGLLEKIVHPDDRKIYPRHFHNEDDIEEPIDFRIIARNGEVRWISHICQPVFRSDGRYMGRRASNRDITDRKMAIEQIASLSKFPDENPDPVLRIATDGTIIYANRGSAPLIELWGCRAGQRLPEGYRNLINDVLKSGNGREIEIPIGIVTYSLVLTPLAEMGYVNIYGRDITKRKQAEIALQEANEELEVTAEELRQQNDELISAQSAIQESEQKYRTIVETANEGIWVVDSETRTTYTNRRMAEMLGYSSEEMVGRKSSEFMDEEGKARLSLLLERRRQGITESFEIKFLCKDGSPLWALTSASPLRDKDGRFVGSLGMLTDITERKQAEERLRITLESIGDGFFACDADWRFVYVNAPAERILGIRREDVLGKNHWEVFPLTLGTNLEREYRRAAAGEIRDFENFYEPWGRWFHNRCFPREGGGMSVYFVDITERKQAEEELRKNEARFKVLIQNLNSGVALVDEYGKFTIVNPAFLKMFGISGDLSDIKNVNDQNRCEWQVFDEDGNLLNVDDHPVRKAAMTCKPVRNKLVGVRLPSGGDLTWMLISAEPILKPDGRIELLICTYHDVTEHIRAEEALLKSRDELELRVQERTADLTKANEELTKAKDLAEAAVKSKIAFLANMSHELRTPMNAVIGFSSLLLNDNLTEEHKEYIEGIRKGGEALLALINDILDFSRAEKGKIELECQPFSLKHLIEESLGMVAALASKKGLNLSETINYGTPDTIIGDHGRLRQILVNLLRTL